MLLPLELGQTESITITGVADQYGIQTVKIAFEGSNHTMTNVGSGSWHYSLWNPSAVGDYPYFIYIQDGAGNWNMINGTIQVKELTPPIPAFALPLLILGLALVGILVILKKRTLF